MVEQYTGTTDTAKKPVEMPVNEVAHVLDNLTNLYYRLGWATARSRAGGKNQFPGQYDRSLWVRVRRAELLEELAAGKITKKAAVTHGKRLDSADRQFATQSIASIDMGELGEQKAEKVELFIPKDGEDEEKARNKPPIFIIPAYSGDLYGIEPLLKEAAIASGRRVISVATPESHGGEANEKLEKAIVESQTMDPYVDFFKKAIDTFVGQESEVELWGYSTGGVVMAEILTDSRYQDRVINAVAIAPAGCVEQSPKELNWGVLRELPGLVAQKARSAGMSVVTSPKQPVEVNMRQRRKTISKAVMERMVLKASNAWDTAKVR